MMTLIMMMMLAYANEGLDSVAYFSTMPFRESPYPAARGIHPLSQEQAASRNHFRFAYDDKRRPVRIAFQLGNEARGVDHNGPLFFPASQMHIRYDSGGKSYTFYDPRGNPKIVYGAVFRFVFTNDDQGRPQSLTFEGINDKPVASNWGIFRYHWTQQADGTVIEERFDEEGQPAKLRPGFDFYRLRLHYNEDGLLTLMQNIDARGELVANKSGAAQDKLEWDESNNMVAWNVLNEHNKRIRRNGPMVARGIRSFETFGLESGLRYEDEFGKGMATAYGFWNSHTTYNPQGNMQERTFLGPKGHPQAHAKAGYVRLEMDWDRSRPLERRYYDARGKLVNHATRGYARVVWRYDGGNLSRTRFLGKTGRLVNRQDTGIAEIRAEYDDRGRLLTRSFHNQQGRLVKTAQGHTRTDYFYRKDGRPMTPLHSDQDGRPTNKTVKKPPRSDEVLRKALARCVSNWVETEGFQGNVLVAREGKVLFHEAFGKADVDRAVANTLTTPYLIGSLTKSLTATAVLRLVEHGDMDLAAAIGQYLPELKSPWAKQVTIDHLLGLRSGLPNHLKRLTGERELDLTSKQMVALIDTADLSFPAGERYAYSNINYQLLALAMERITSTSYANVMRDMVFEPAGMNTAQVVAQRAPRDLALGYSRQDNRSQPAPPMILGFAMGSGNITATCEDILAFDKALYGNSLLSEESKRSMSQHRGPEWGNFGYGFRFLTYEREHGQGTLMRFGGSMSGQLANLHRYLDDRVTVLVLANIRPFPIRKMTRELHEVLAAAI